MDPYYTPNVYPPPALITGSVLPKTIAISGWTGLIVVLVFIALLFLLLILLNVYFIYLPSRQLTAEFSSLAADTREVVCAAAAQAGKQLSFCPTIPPT